jgi:hypothetical protein
VRHFLPIRIPTIAPNGTGFSGEGWELLASGAGNHGMSPLPFLDGHGNAMDDAHIRAILIEYLKASDEKIRIYQEKSIGASICDVMAVTDKLSGYEKRAMSTISSGSGSRLPHTISSSIAATSCAAGSMRHGSKSWFPPTGASSASRNAR